MVKFSQITSFSTGETAAPEEGGSKLEEIAGFNSNKMPGLSKKCGNMAYINF